MIVAQTASTVSWACPSSARASLLDDPSNVNVIVAMHHSEGVLFDVEAAVLEDAVLLPGPRRGGEFRARVDAAAGVEVVQQGAQVVVVEVLPLKTFPSPPPHLNLSPSPFLDRAAHRTPFVADKESVSKARLQGAGVSLENLEVLQFDTEVAAVVQGYPYAPPLEYLSHLAILSIVLYHMRTRVPHRRMRAQVTGHARAHARAHRGRNVSR